MNKPTIIEMQEVTDANELAKTRKQREQFDRNSAWLQSNILDIYAKHRGKCICVAGQEVFVADTARRDRAGHSRPSGGCRMVYAVHSKGKGGQTLCGLMVNGFSVTTESFGQSSAQRS